MKNAFKARRTLFLSTLALTGLSGFFSSAAKSQTPQANNASATNVKAVFAVTDADSKKWGLTLGNVKNTQKELGSNVTLEIVVYGPAIGMLLATSEVAEKVAQAIAAGVKIVACKNTMRGSQLRHADMVSTIGYVPSGVVALILRQNDGYAYIRS